MSLRSASLAAMSEQVGRPTLGLYLYDNVVPKKARSTPVARSCIMRDSLKRSMVMFCGGKQTCATLKFLRISVEAGKLLHMYECCSTIVHMIELWKLRNY